MDEKYFIGLDIGTDSVGYAVTDEQYKLIKYKGEPEWGVHLFDPAKLNDERRGFRTARRRLDRRKQRVKLVQGIFAGEISKIDENFYRRIEESTLWREDSSYAHTLFEDADYSDREYYKQYPTIHHLICELIGNDAPHDVRLVYAACAWLVAHRGHFLSEVSKDNVAEMTNFASVYEEFMQFFEYSKPWKCDAAEFFEILKKKSGVNAKYKELCSLLFSAQKAPKTEAVEDEPYYSKEAMLKLLCGGKASPKDLFGNDEYADIESFSLDGDDTEIAATVSAVGDDAELIIRLKAMYDCAVLADILSGKQYISEAKVEIYKEHKNDLYLLKKVVRKYKSEKYREVFREDGQANYKAYIEKNALQEDFCKYLKKLFEGISLENDAVELNGIMEKINSITLCPKQVSTENRVIPRQVYYIELEKILDNASTYLPFLSEIDADGLTAREKILSVFNFKIPYFVGPLNRGSKDFSWFVRKSEGKIYPWNFERLVDFEKSEQAFIDRMTNTCTYLPFADVLPKCSLLHQKFQVLNEINSLTVNGRRVPVEVKQRLYNELFMTKKKVTKKSIEEFLLCNAIFTKEDLKTLSGIDDKIKSSLSSRISFDNLIKNGKLSEEDAEEIIKRATYTEDRVRFRKWLGAEFSSLSADDIRYISNLKFKDFARLSRELLCEVYGEPDRKTGEVFSIIDRMWNENVNLMELYSDRYTYKEQIMKAVETFYRENPKSIGDRLKEMCISNAVKRPILRTLDIVTDVVKTNRAAPAKIFVEMARGGKSEEKGKRSKSRYQQLKELYEKCSLEDARLMSEMLDKMGDDRDNRLQGEKLFLYYLQLGRSMYSGKRIVLSNLSDEKMYDVDHIYPQSKVKDDSVLNNKVLVLSEENGAKGNMYPISQKIRSEMGGWWKFLHDNGFINDEKYKRLVRNTPFDENEEWGFINRQLVETRQSTKAVATLLKEKYPDTEIVYVKAGLVSEFRQEFDMLKSRSVNDLHHAKDAYLNIVVGNVYSEKFTRKWFFEHKDDYNLKVKSLFGNPVKTYKGETVWNGGKSIEQIRNTVYHKNAVHMTKYAFCKKGGLFDQNLVKASAGLVSRKEGLPTEKYGGYRKTAASFFVLTKYTVGEKTNVMIMPVELMHAKRFSSDFAFAERYAEKTVSEIVGKSVSGVSFPLNMRQIKVGTVMELDGMRATVNGKSSGGRSIIISLFNPLIIGYEWEKYVKHLERFTEKKKEHPSMIYSEKYDKVCAEKNILLYDLLADKMSSKVYGKRPANPVQTLKTGREKFIHSDIFEQSKCLLQIISVFGRNAGGCDFTTIGGTKKEGMVRISSIVGNWTKNFSDARIVDQSASGLHEKKSENLFDLL